MITAPYGSWRSPITTEMIIAGTVSLDQIVLDGKDVYWLEGRPQEKGRYVIVRRDAAGQITDMLPEPFNARTRVHEYGGASYTVHQGTIYFTHFSDQRLYQLRAGEEPTALTPESEAELRYADMVIDPKRNRLFAVREDHRPSDREAINTIVSVSLDRENEGDVLASGADFYSNPRVSPDGSQLAYLCWNHPNMPWDGCELWLADLDEKGAVTHREKIAGGEAESIFQPEWSPDGALYFVSDRNGWWNLYRHHEGKVETVCAREAEFGKPGWVFGIRTYAILSAESIICTYGERGLWKLALLDPRNGNLRNLPIPWTEHGSLCSDGLSLFCTAGSASETTALVEIDLSTTVATIVRRSSKAGVDLGYLSEAEPIEYPTEDGLTAHAFYYAPKNKDFQAPDRELPPLIVISHGGPTGATTATLRLSIQFWTSRGFAVLDVNYGGSTGYGRSYRERLKDQWGIIDVDDCVNGAKYLTLRNLADAKRLAIRGGSAGGYTTLSALTFRDTFSAGASHYGVSDLAALAKETHKFESRYLDGLIGPYPEAKALYEERSPIHHTERLSCPVILFQGLEDKVVLPNQAEMMVEALKQKGLPVAYVAFEGEQHGFRQAANIKRALEAELYFYSRIFYFEPADALEPVVIDNL